MTSSRSAWIALAAVWLTACATGPGVLRPLDEDLVALQPTDRELVVDIDLAQLRNWHLGEVVKELVYRRLPVPAAIKETLWQADSIAIGVRGLGDWQTADVLVIVKGEPPLPKPPDDAAGLRTRAHLVATSAASAPGVDGVPRGVDVVRLGARLYAMAPPDELDRLIERVDRHRLGGPGDALREVLQLAPSGKYGRPAVRLAARLPGEVRQRIAEALPAIASTDDVALALAVADGFDLGMVLRMRSESDAKSGAEELRRELQRLADRPIVTMMNLGPLLEPLRTGRRESDLHIAYRLPRRQAEMLFERVASLVRLTEGVMQRMQREKAE